MEWFACVLFVYAGEGIRLQYSAGRWTAEEAGNGRREDYFDRRWANPSMGEAGKEREGGRRRILDDRCTQGDGQATKAHANGASVAATLRQDDFIRKPYITGW